MARTKGWMRTSPLGNGGRNGEKGISPIYARPWLTAFRKTSGPCAVAMSQELALSLFPRFMRCPCGLELRYGVSREPNNCGGARAVVRKWFRMLLLDRRLKVMLHTACFPESIAPASPIHAKPVIPFDARRRFKLFFPQWRAAVGLCGSSDFLEDLQLRHRNRS